MHTSSCTELQAAAEGPSASAALSQAAVQRVLSGGAPSAAAAMAIASLQLLPMATDDSTKLSTELPQADTLQHTSGLRCSRQCHNGCEISIATATGGIGSLSQLDGQVM